MKHSGWKWAVAVAAVSAPIALWAAPKVGGVGTLQHFRFSHASTDTFAPINGLALSVRSGDLKNGGDDYVIGPMQILDVKNTTKAPMCFRVNVEDMGGDGQIDGSGRAWWIGKGKTLRNVASIHTLQQYQCRDRYCRIQLTATAETWQPIGKRNCG